MVWQRGPGLPTLLLWLAVAALVVEQGYAAHFSKPDSTSVDSMNSDGPPHPTTPPPVKKGGREEVSFDFGWRFHLGDPGIDPDSNCTFPKNLTGYQCLGLFATSAKTLESCKASCCDTVGCAIWQWGGQPDNPAMACWVGTSESCSPNKAWQSGARNTTINPPPAQSGPTSRSYDDGQWQLVDVPHDAIIGGAYSQNATRSHGYLPYNRTWYRKHFNVPAEWKSTNSSIWLYFEGVFHMTTVYLNGEFALPIHRGGYTSFSVRLDNISSLLYGNGTENENVVAVVASASGGSGWWYEGGGIYRHAYLVRTPTQVHIVTHGLNPMTGVTGDISWNDASDPAQGLFASAASVAPVVEIVNDAAETLVGARYTINVALWDEAGKLVTSNSMATSSDLPARTGVKVAVANLTLGKTQLWSAQRTYMYKLQVAILGTDGATLDNVEQTIGFRQAKWTSDSGFYLNGQAYKWRGFCDHNDFAGVGVAVPERINLYRAQTMKAVGGNSWRMSHNPPVPALLDILDRVGIVVWDENRDFYNTTYDVDNQRSMVKRDRHHPSVMCWSFCNEAGCESQNAAVGAIFRAVSKEEDTTRPVTGNMFDYGPGKLSDVIEVQGFSHQGGQRFDSFHKDHPDRPVIGSECCSCTTQRGEDVGNGSAELLSNFNGDCLEGQTGVEMSRKFVSGLLVWTLFDYYGEPAFGWPHRSSSFGAIDLAGFPKAAAWYYKSWWLLSPVNMSSSPADRPHRPIALRHPMQPLHEQQQQRTQRQWQLNPSDNIDDDESALDLVSVSGNNDAYTIHIVQHWQPDVGGSKRTIQAHTNAPQAELFVNGASQGKSTVVWIGYAKWNNVQYTDGNLTAVGLDGTGKVVTSHTVMTPGPPVKLLLSVDAPSAATGTGSSLVLDGFDTAMLSAQIVDSRGQVVPGAAHNVTFSVASGPGRVVAVGNGDPRCHEPNQASWRSAYHGLARVFVRVTEHRAGSGRARDTMLQVDAEGNRVTRVFPSGHELDGIADAIVVKATTTIGGQVAMATASVPVSADASRHGVLETAQRWMRS